MAEYKLKLCLSVFDRIILLEIIDKIHKNIITEYIINELKKQLSFTDSELINLNIRITDGRYYWKTEFDKIKDVFIGGYTYKILKDSLTELKEQNILSGDHLSLCDKFIE